MVDNTWTVVQFLDDTTVEAVPSSWIQGNNCHWPSFAPEKLINAIKKSEPLNTCWPSHQIKIFRNATFDDYWIARNKAKIAENTSELETESDTGNNKKRKVIQKILSSSDEESIEESILPSPPKIKRPSKRNYGQENKNNGLEIMVQKSTNEVDSSSSDPLCQKNLNNLSSITSINDESIIRESTDQTTQCKCRFEIGETVKPLLQQGHILRGMMLEILGEVKQLRQELVARTQTTSESFFRSVSSVVFPISSDEDMVLFEDYLQDSTNFNNAVSELVKVGGSKAYDFVSRVGKLIITNEQALKYSWLGQKGKQKFCDTRIANLIIEALIATNLAKTTKEAQSAIQLWLRRAFDRNNYKINKKN